MSLVFHWSPAYETGIVAIDEDHRQLVETINFLFAAMTQHRPNLIYERMGLVHDYTQYHFAREESLMAEVGYPGLEEHKSDHKFFHHQFVKLMDRDPRVLILKVSVFLYDWLHDHLMVADRDFFQYMKEPKTVSAVLRQEHGQQGKDKSQPK